MESGFDDTITTIATGCHRRLLETLASTSTQVPSVEASWDGSRMDMDSTVYFVRVSRVHLAIQIKQIEALRGEESGKEAWRVNL